MMRAIFVLTSCVGLLATPTVSRGQILVETFDYPPGQLTNLNAGTDVSKGKWVSLSGTGNPIMVVEGSLLYDGYPSSGGGNKILVRSVSSSAEDAAIAFAPRNAGSVFASFLFCVTDTSGLRTQPDSIGDYFVAFLPTTSSTTFVGRVSIRRGVTRGSFQLGVRASAQNSRAEWSGCDLGISATHLVVVSYSLVPGSKNDTASLWVNPDLRSVLPPPLVSQVGASASEPSDLGRLVVRQDGTDTPDAAIDGIRVGNGWNEAPLPIQLVAFSGVRVGTHRVRLEWMTQSEINNYGFLVERSCGRQEFSLLSCSFLSGGGTTLLHHSYAFIDSSACDGECLYRLQQMDLDGTIHYSEPIVVSTLASVRSPVTEKCPLFQNFPNPFNPDTEIQFAVASGGRTRVEVFRLTGERLAVLFDGDPRPGETYRLRFDGRRYASGEYICRLSNNSGSRSLPMLLVK